MANPLFMLVVDDEQSTLASLSRIFTSRGFETQAAATVAEASADISAHVPDIVLLDIHLPDGNGLSLLESLRARAPECSVIMMTAYADLETAVAALRLGAADYIIKPFELEQVLHAVDRVTERRRLTSPDPRDPRSTFGFTRIITRNARFLAVMESLKKVAASDTNILITGESGTGKELIARAVHAASRRADRPLVPVNCGAIPAGLMEAEFFGHVRGAFTGAIADHKGYFERANGSTLFLDEIGEMPLDLQVKLLRVLQERQLNRVGDGRPIKLDFRLIAATARDLMREARDNRFRQDLFYRLNVFPVELPPLRERPEDLEPLCRAFLAELGRPELSVTEAAMEVLRRHRWPGNVRELYNVIERAALVAEGKLITPVELPPGLPGGEARVRVEIPPDAHSYRAVVKEAADHARREMVLRALSDNDGNVTRSARVLGISRRQLINLMRELGLRRPEVDDEA